MIIFAINIVFAILFYSACNVAADEGRIGWAWVYLIVSAWNGAAAMSSIF